MEQVTEQEQAMDSQQAADLARLAAMAADEPAAPGAAPEPEQEPRMDAVESLAGMLGMIAPVATYADMPRTAAVWAPEKCTQLAGVVVPVLRKYPWGGPVLEWLETGAGSEEIMLAFVAVPMAMATWQAARADMAPREKPAPADAAPEDAEGVRP